jgi:hypothetical protein
MVHYPHGTRVRTYVRTTGTYVCSTSERYDLINMIVYRYKLLATIMCSYVHVYVRTYVRTYNVMSQLVNVYARGTIKLCNTVHVYVPHGT